jgi:hypothetical protein
MLRTLIAIFMLALAVTTAWVWFHPVALPEPRNIRVQDDEWHLPTRGKHDMNDSVATIEQDKLWGNGPGGLPLQAPVEEKPLTAPNWHIVGVVAAGKDSYAMIDVEGQPMLQLKTGDKLPGGIKIVKMTADRVCILLNGKKRVLKTYKE